MSQTPGTIKRSTQSFRRVMYIQNMKKWRESTRKQGSKCCYVGMIKHYCEQAILVTSVVGLSGLGLPIEKSLI